MSNAVGINLVLETEPKPDDVRLLEDRIYEFNVQATGISECVPSKGKRERADAGKSSWKRTSSKRPTFTAGLALKSAGALKTILATIGVSRW
jgi:hypothetical protein